MPAVKPTNREKERAALVSLGVKLALTAAKFAAAGVSGSLALASEAGNNLGDVAVTLLSLYSIRVSAKPADADHPFGHGKVEAVSALVQVGFLFALAAFILIEAGKRLIYQGVVVMPDAFAFAVLAVSIVVDLGRWLSLKRIADASRSPALAADALNFASDIVSSTMALGGLLATSLGFRSGDTLAAIGVAAFIAIAGFRLARETVDMLIDAAPRGLTEPIQQSIAAVPGVISVSTLRLRSVGAEVMGEAIIRLPRTLSIEQVDKTKKDVVSMLMLEHPDVRITLTAEPVALDDETVVERVFLIARRLQIPVHHITVQTLAGGNRSVSFDAEVDGSLPLASAHDEVTRLENAIKDELGSDFEVESHIEPLEVNELVGENSSAPIQLAVAEALDRLAPQVPHLSFIHDVRVRTTPLGLVVNYHCIVDDEMTVEGAHTQVDMLERLMRHERKDIVRIVGHTEPKP